jgi:hypothetical protein
MALLETIQNDLKSAMREKKTVELSTLRGLSAAIKNEEIAKRPATLTEDDLLAVVKREVKKLNDAIADFETGGRADLAAEYRAQAVVLSGYLPAQASEDEVRKAVKDVLAAASDKNFGAVMKAAMAALKGKADGQIVSKIVKEELAG